VCKYLRWHLDKVYVKINCLAHYLWRAVDYEGMSYSPTLGQIFGLFKLLPSSADRFQCC
jgi:hypothetical protein